MLETAWISDSDGPGEAVRELDPVELLLDCLPQFDLINVAQANSSEALPQTDEACAKGGRRVSITKHERFGRVPQTDTGSACGLDQNLAHLLRYTAFKDSSAQATALLT